MTVELRPLGVRCNLQCQYCYQNPQRDVEDPARSYDMRKMKDAIRAEGGPFSLFGGEPLMMPLGDLEELWSWGLAEYGSNSLQTNGVLISDTHIDLFRKYKVHVGISLDGPDDLNDARWHHTLDRTRASTDRVQAQIERLCREGMPPSLIITLHRHNAASDKLPHLLAWIRRLVGLGVRWFRLHLLESESASIRAKYALSDEENIAALVAFAALERELPDLHCDVFEDIRRMLSGQDRDTTCVWNACDPWTTRAVRGVEGHGQRSNCGRTNKDGIDFVKAEREGFERSLALYQTPQDCGGCKGCRFFLTCKGQCPGTAIDGDWRNRSEHCAIWKAVFERMEQELADSGQVPLSLHPDRRKLEQSFLAAWSEGSNSYLCELSSSSDQLAGDRDLDWRAELADIMRELSASLASHGPPRRS